MRTVTGIGKLVLAATVLLFGGGLSAQQDTFVLVSTTTAREIEGSSEALGVSGSWAAPDSTVVAILITAKVSLSAGAKVSTQAFRLTYQAGSQTESRRCVALDVRAAAKDKVRLAFAGTQNVEWTAGTTGTYFVTLAFINVPRDTREATLLRDGAAVAKVQLPM